MKRLLVALAVVPAAAWAGGYAVPNTNARDLSLAGSAVAGQLDATAAYVNPAALSGLDGPSVVANGTVIDFRSQWTAPGGGLSSESLLKGAFPPSFFAGYGGKYDGRGWGVGFGYNVPFGGNVFWPNGWPGSLAVLTVNRRTYGLYFTGGIQPIPQVKIGGGLIYYRTTEDLTQDALFPGQTQPAGVEVGTSGGKVSYDVSAEFTPLAGFPLTLGVDYKHKADQSLTGHAHIENAPSGLGPFALDQGVNHALTVPNLLNVGAAVRVLPNLLVTAAWTLDRWIVYKQDLFVGNAGLVVPVNRNYTNGYTFRVGGELSDLVPNLTLRAGVLRDISPTRTDALDPSIPDADSTAIAVGVGYTFISNLTVNATYFHAFFDSIAAVAPSNVPGSFDTRANILTVGVAWQPGGRPTGLSAALARGR
jgi:long-chain fatty acid transport protein